MIGRLAHALLRPILRLFLYRLSGVVNDLPVPQDAPHAHASGADPDRILLYGSGPAMGYGVLSHELALPGQLARRISAATGRGVDVDVVSDTDLTIQDAVEPLVERELWRYDAIMLTIGVNNALLLTSVRVWRRELKRLLDHLEANVTSSTSIYIVAIPPISTIDIFAGITTWFSERHANVLNSETRRAVAGREGVTFIPFAPLGRPDFTRYRSAATYQQWASILAAPVISDLARSTRDEEARILADEWARQNALLATRILDTPAEERFDRIAVLGSQLLGSPYTAITFIDDDRQWLKASSGWPVRGDELSRAGSFGDAALRSAPPLVVRDARTDPRFADHPFVTGEPFVRFYAAYPIESAYGERIGIFCVVDLEPREWTDADTQLLRDLAIMVQRELRKTTDA